MRRSPARAAPVLIQLALPSNYHFLEAKDRCTALQDRADLLQGCRAQNLLSELARADLMVNDPPNPASLGSQCRSTFDKLGIIQPVHPIGHEQEHHCTSDKRYAAESRWRCKSEEKTEEGKGPGDEGHDRDHSRLGQAAGEQPMKDVPGIRSEDRHAPKPA